MITEEELIWKLKDLTQSRLPAYEIVRKAFDTRTEFHKSGEIILLEKFAPWKGSLVEIEKECDLQGKIKFAIFGDSAGSWRVSTIPPTAESFDMRVPLHQDWRGLRDKELKEVSGFDDVIFVHMTGFIGGAKSQATAIKMAELSIEAHELH